jgi:hypothetical protein
MIPTGSAIKQQRSYQILLWLNLVLYLLCTVVAICSGYTVWLAFVKLGDTQDQITDILLDAFPVYRSSANERVLLVESLATTTNVAIADAIMVNLTCRSSQHSQD